MTRHSSDVLRITNSHTNVSLSYGSWRQPSTERTIFLGAEVFLDPSDLERADNHLEIDIDGDGTDDINLQMEQMPTEGASNRTFTYIIPPGYYYQIVNQTDPNNNNAIQSVIEYEL